MGVIGGLKKKFPEFAKKIYKGKLFSLSTDNLH